MWVDLPKEIRGPGRVLVQSVEPVEFNGGVTKLALCLPYSSIEKSPYIQMDRLEGRVVELTR